MKVAIMTPIRHGTVHHEFAESLCATWRGIKNMDLAWFKTIGNSILPDARAMCAAQALAWGADKLIFIDDDISWSVPDFCFLVTHKVSICTGAYATRRGEGDTASTVTVQFLDEGRKTTPQGLIEVKGAGFGFIRFDREVFDGLRDDCLPMWDEALPKNVCEHFRDWFPYGMNFSEQRGRHHRSGEDVNFCHRAREKGFRTYLDPAIQLGHHAGNEVYRANIIKAA